MIRIYVAGPFSPLSSGPDAVLEVTKNMRVGIQYAADMLKCGYAVFCPWLDFQFGLYTDISAELYYENSIEWLRASHEVHVMPGWEHSKGTKEEIKIAEAIRIPVQYVTPFTQFGLPINCYLLSNCWNPLESSEGLMISRPPRRYEGITPASARVLLERSPDPGPIKMNTAFWGGITKQE